MRLLAQVAFQLVTLLITYLVWRRFGLIGLLIGVPIAFLFGFAVPRQSIGGGNTARSGDFRRKRLVRG